MNYLSSEIDRTTRGYTGHEHLDEVGIIHMNGRIYDAELGRFLQADPFIQDPYDTQSLNRYTYVFNNPMSNNDPTGYFSMDVFFKNYGRPLAAIAVSFIPGANTYGIIMLKGAISGAITGGTKGAVIGAFTAAAFHGIGEGFDGLKKGEGFMGTGLKGGHFAAKIAAHGLVGGASSVLQGGKFGHGFLAAGATQAFAPAIGKITVGPQDGKFLRITVAALVGGTISEATGGKFAMGAITGAFSRAFNDEAQEEKEEEKVRSVGIYGAVLSSSENRVLEDIVQETGGELFKANQERKIVKYIRSSVEDGFKVRVFGYSRGGNAAYSVVNKLGKLGVDVDLLVTFDAHSLSDSKVFRIEYNNVKKAFNFYQRNKRTGGRFLPTGDNPFWGSPATSKHIKINQTNFTGLKTFSGEPVSHLNIVTHSRERL